ncbi:hydrolase [Peziza echinospora]|nr:hydrolase [Peziza echinospora]
MSPTADIATTTTAAGPEVTAIQQNDVEVGAGNLEKRIGDIEITPKKEAYVPRYIDVAINLADEVYSGVYHGRKVHEDDHADVVQRALDVGCLKMMITGSDLESSRRAIALAEKFPGILYATVGVHPCQALHFEDKKHGSPEDHLNELEKLVVEGKKKGVVMAFGEIGLDYDRLNHCPAPSQLTHFASQLLLARRLNLPLFLHSRAAATDFENLLIPHIPHLPGCLVHSFTGTLAEMQRLVDLGLYIGINGCSLKTLENLDVVRQVPLDRIMLETDGPWCEIRKSSAGYGYLLEKEEDEGSGVNGNGNNPPPVQRGEGKPRKKDRWLKGYMVSGRNEPVTIEQVAWIVARVKGVSLEVLCEAAWKNTVKVFGLGEKKVE